MVWGPADIFEKATIQTAHGLNCICLKISQFDFFFGGGGSMSYRLQGNYYKFEHLQEIKSQFENNL
jgi:hypothetical protein